MGAERKWTVLLYLPAELGEEEENLLAAVRETAIRVCPLNRRQMLDRPTDGEGQGRGPEGWLGELGLKPEECLMIVGTEETLLLAEEEGIPTLPYRAPGSPWWRFSEEPYVMEGFGDVDALFLERRYQRFYDIPWIMGETKRCVIRELSMADVPALFELYSQPHVTDHMAGLFQRDEEYAYQRQYIDRVYHYYEFGMWLVFEKATGKLIGRVGLEPRGYPKEPSGGSSLEEEISVMELGYLIAPDHQRQGFATEVCSEVIRMAFADYEAPELHCLIEPDNVPSIGLAEKLGFAFIGNMHMDGREFMHYILTADSCNFS